MTDIYLAIQEHFPEVKTVDIQNYLKNCQGIKFSNFDSLENPQSGDNLSQQAQKSSKTQSRQAGSNLGMNSPLSTVRTVVPKPGADASEKSKIITTKSKMSNNKPFCDSPDDKMISPRKLNFSG